MNAVVMETVERLRELPPGKVENAWIEIGRDRAKYPYETVRAIFLEFYRPDLEAKLRRWMEGTLFAAQKMTFDAWLSCSEEAIKEDCERANEIVSMLEAARDDSLKEVKAFVVSRIWTPSFSQRQHLLKPESTAERNRFYDRWCIENESRKWVW